MQPSKRVVLALDAPPLRRALSVASDSLPHVDAFKVGWPLIVSDGREAIRLLGSLGKPVLVDLKAADIPNTNRLVCEAVFSAGAAGVTAHAFPGKDSLAACVEAARRWKGLVFAVTEMSHPGAVEFMQDRAEALARTAVEAGADGIVAPATRPERIAALRKVVGKRTIISPGVGTQGGSPADAIRAGADYVIVGRTITESPQPAKAAAEVATAVAGAGHPH